MANRKIPVLLAISTLALVAIIGTLTYRSVSAQTPTPTAQAPGTAEKEKSGRLPGGKHGGYTKEELAAALGIDVESLTTAVETANKAALDQAVSQGLITQEQADAYLANGLEGRHFGKVRGLEANGINYDALLADALGISIDDLLTAKQEAFNTAIDHAVADGTLTQEQADLLKGQNALFSNENFQTSMRSAFEAAVNQAVADGTITQAQADAILSSQTGTHVFDGHGFGRRGGRHGGFPPASPDSTPETGGDV